MRRLFLVLLIAFLLIAATGCTGKTIAGSSGATTETAGKIYWTINENRIDHYFEHAPKNTYNQDGSFKSVEEVATLLFDYTHEKSFRLTFPFTVVPKGATKLEIPKIGVAAYIPDEDAFKLYESGKAPESMRLWLVFLDKNDEAWCWEYVGYDGWGGLFDITNPGSNQVLKIKAIALRNTWSPDSKLISFLLVSDRLVD